MCSVINKYDAFNRTCLHWFKYTVSAYVFNII